MPISPANMLRYPGSSIRSPEWLAIRERIKRRADNRCEECGVENHAIGGRLRDGTFLPNEPKGTTGLGLDWPKPGEYAWFGSGPDRHHLKVIRIVCTVAHIDGKLEDHSDGNLAFWCQRCHNRHDMKSRQENATITRHEKAGQLDLLGRK